MKTSANGAKILHGGGLQSVREHIQRAFQEIHNGTRLDHDIEMIEEVKLAVPPVPRKSLRPLAEKAEPILRAAAHHNKGAVAPTHHNAVHRSSVHIISIPRKSADRLIAEALQLLGRKR